MNNGKNQQPNILSYFRTTLVFRSQSSFTLVELLVVIGILAILTAAVVVIINPAEYLRSSRDAKRMSDLSSIDKALSVLETQGTTSFGTANRVYISIADNASSTCGSLGLPALPTNWFYQCVTDTDLQKIDGTGWIPVNFSASTALSFSALPTDPSNSTTTSYYTYTPGGSWEMNTFLESKKYRLSGDKDRTSTDGGDSYAVYEVGSNKVLSPFSDSGLVGYWRFDEGSGTTANDASGNNRIGTLNNGPVYTNGKAGYALSSDGDNDYVSVSTALALTTSGTLVVWVNLNSWKTSYDSIIFKGSGVGWTSINYGMFRDSTGSIFLGTINNGTNNLQDFGPKSSAISPNSWAFLAFSWDGTNAAFTHNSNRSSISWPYNTISSSSNMTFGISVNGSYYPFNGLIDDIRIYDRALSASEIIAIYDSTK